jgi:MOSC domain-containing protein YiiM
MLELADGAERSAAMMKLVSVNVGAPRLVNWRGQQTSTGIFKSPVAGPVALRKLNLNADRQADLRVHGGPDRAAYIYPAEHYDLWKAELDRPDLPWGIFGENLTTLGLSEADIRIGDQIRIGSAVLVATQPRMPCFKLGIRFGDQRMVARFNSTDRCGVYVGVVEEGLVEVGDEIEIVSRASDSMSIVELRRIYLAEDDPAAIRRVLSLPALSHDWRMQFEERLAAAEQAARKSGFPA